MTLARTVVLLPWGADSRLDPDRERHRGGLKRRQEPGVHRPQLVQSRGFAYFGAVDRRTVRESAQDGPTRIWRGFHLDSVDFSV